MKKRKCVFKKYSETDKKFQSEFCNEGIFHQWANSYVEFESGPGNFTYAIVESPDGTINEVLPCHIKFIN
jgi:hypothetical protein